MKNFLPNRKEMKELGEALSQAIVYLDSVPTSRNFDHAKKISDLIGFFVRLLFLSIISKFLSIAIENSGYIQGIILIIPLLFFVYLQIYFSMIIASLFGKFVFKSLPNFIKLEEDKISERWRLFWSILFVVILLALQWSISRTLSDMAERQLTFQPVPEHSQQR